MSDTPESTGFDPAGLRQVDALLQRWVETDRVPAVALCVGRRGRCLPPRCFGSQRADALFVVASITKPITAAAVVMLAERGLLSLHDRVAEFLPEFGRNGKEDVRVLHLLTHTSGLPDMLADNVRLRRAHAPLADFVERTCRLAPAFAPGTAVSYQSMGFAVLAEIVHQASGRLLPEFLAREVFEPLGMDDTALGVAPDRRGRVAAIRVPADQEAGWGWNSPYWLGLGVPWGGLITSPADLGRFCLMMLGGGALGTTRILSPAAVQAMTANQLALMPLIPEADRRCRPWGLGWRLNWPGTPSSFGDLLGPRTYGHWGSTGTLCWIDPDAGAFMVLLTTQPLEADGRLLSRVSNLVAAALR